MLDPQPSGSLPHQGNVPSGRLDPFALKALDLGVDSPDLRAQYRKRLLKLFPIFLGGICGLRELVVCVQNPATTLEDCSTVFNPSSHPLQRGPRHCAWHGVLVLVVRCATRSVSGT
jgi:hypothetical protein